MKYNKVIFESKVFKTIVSFGYLVNQRFTRSQRASFFADGKLFMEETTRTRLHIRKKRLARDLL